MVTIACYDLLTFDTSLSESVIKCLSIPPAYVKVFSDLNDYYYTATIQNVIDSTHIQIDPGSIFFHNVIDPLDNNFLFTDYTNGSLSGEFISIMPYAGYTGASLSAIATVGSPLVVSLENASLDCNISIFNNSTQKWDPLIGFTNTTVHFDLCMLIPDISGSGGYLIISPRGTGSVEQNGHVSIQLNDVQLGTVGTNFDQRNRQYAFDIMIYSFTIPTYSQLKFNYSISGITYKNCKGDAIENGYDFKIQRANPYGYITHRQTMFSNTPFT